MKSMVSKKNFIIGNNFNQSSLLITRWCYVNCKIFRCALSYRFLSQPLFKSKLKSNNLNRLRKDQFCSLKEDENGPNHNGSHFNRFLPLEELKNEGFESFLKAQELVKDENEWNQMMTIMRQPLPTSIRVNKNPFNQHLLVKEYLEFKASSEWFVGDSG